LIQLSNLRQLKMMQASKSIKISTALFQLSFVFIIQLVKHFCVLESKASNR